MILGGESLDAFARLPQYTREVSKGLSPLAELEGDVSRSRSVRILVVEDEPDLLKAIVQSLGEEGHAADRASDGEEGLYKARTWEYDAIVLDVMLPKLDGWEFLKRLRAVKTTPVLVLTARDSVGDRVRGLDSGADDYLIKPFALGELLARIRALIRRSAGHAHPEIVIGDVSIDTVSKIVTKAGEPVSLTAREYSLVELLAIRRGGLVSRAEIYDHVFGEDDDTLSNVVDVHMSHIRKKLGKDFIETRRGQGYVVSGS